MDFRSTFKRFPSSTAPGVGALSIYLLSMHLPKRKLKITRTCFIHDERKNETA